MVISRQKNLDMGFRVRSELKRQHGEAYAETGASAQRLNRLVTDIFLEENVPVLSLQPSASARTCDGELYTLDAANIRTALEHNLIPLIYGDVAFDDMRGMSIASTDALFAYLAPTLNPSRIIYATAVNGIYTADPLKNADARTIREITPESFEQIRAHIGEPHGVDVTGGMLDKVARGLALAAKLPQTEIVIVGSSYDALFDAITTKQFTHGTQLRSH